MQNLKEIYYSSNLDPIPNPDLQFLSASVRPSVASPISLVRLRSSKHVDSLVKCTEFSLARSSAQVVLPRLIQVALLHKRLRPGDETRYFDFPLDPCLKTL